MVGKRRGGKHRHDSSDLRRAQQALAEAKEERMEAERQAGIVARLREGWARVHERDGLADLLKDEFRRTK